MRTTLRFTSVVAGVGLLILWAAIILSANDWLSTSSAAHRLTAGQASVPAPRVFAPAPQAIAPTSQPGASAPQASPPAQPARSESGPLVAPPAAASTPRPATAAVQLTVGPESDIRAAVSVASAAEHHSDETSGSRRGDRDRGHGDGRDRHAGGRGNGNRER